MSYKADSDTDVSSRNSKLYRGKAPIASMDAMEDMDLLSGSNTHLSKLSSDGNMAAGASASVSASATVTASVPVSALTSTGPLSQVKAGAASNVTSFFPGIKYRHLGKTGLKASNIGLGSMKVFNHENPEVAEEIVSLAYESGINLFDISDPYMCDEAERNLGRILRKKGWPRRNYIVCTKIYWHKTDLAGLSRKEIIESVKHSVANLGMDYVDIAIVHKSDTNCPVEEVVRAMNFLLNQGLIMYWGTARWSPFEIFEAYSIAREMHAVGPTLELSEYHWFHREKVELYMAELYNKIGVGLMTWSPISFGLGLNKDDNTQLFEKLSIKNYKLPKLTETVILPPHQCLMDRQTSIGAMNPMATMPVRAIEGTATPNNSAAPMDVTSVTQARMKALSAMAEKMGCNLSQLAIAWQLRNATSQCVIASASTTEQLIEILSSLPIISKITHPVHEEIDKILGNKPVRPPMISTLQTRWAATGGVPPC